MSYQFRLCNFEMDYEGYIKFLLEHHDELNLLYPFAVKLSFISSPLIFGKAMLIFSEDPYQIVGASGFVYGTGPNNYEDRHICQVEVAFLQREYRCKPLFIKGLKVLIAEMKAGNPDVETVQFWASDGQMELEGLFSKFNSLPGSNRFTVNNLVCYQISFRELETYCRRFKNRFNG
ncbi:hypothetical protein GC093_10960 [Paenibacillus sp. LMG 31456]|uniref:Uncharacterized protein n=1 Tax=Paenibacillus foliorum TaxID=2654974 RepID=A0A972GT65_9BACL|nr:hypothetical protein [Paenibacillus foliorum]NOU93738.1 hypothetical protein [Paenibacillus foliorum]